MRLDWLSLFPNLLREQFSVVVVHLSRLGGLLH